MINRQFSDTHFIAITLVVVALLGAQTFRDLMSEDYEDSTIAELSSDSQKPDVARDLRVPASISSDIPLHALLTIDHAAHLDLHCSDKIKQNIVVKGNLFQIQGKSCIKNFNLSELEIINTTNGYTASVFLNGANRYQTDLIQLQDGENKITVQFRDLSGKKSLETLQVHSSKETL
jgi:hypothetical protein